MEIDLKTIEDGDLREDSDVLPTVNCMMLRIPYGFLGSQAHVDYFPTALAIAKELGWVAIDDQTGEPLQLAPPAPLNWPPDTKPRRPWWKFW